MSSPPASSPTVQGLFAAVATACGVPEPRQPAGAVDWAEFVRLVDRHQVAPLVQQAGWLPQAGAPPDTQAAIYERTRRGTLRSLRMLAFQCEAIAALAEAGVNAIVLKGSALAAGAYGSPGARQAGDLDLLVKPDAVPTAVDALRAAGLDWVGWREPDDPDRPPVDPAVLRRAAALPLLHDVTLGRDDLRLELHWRLFTNDALMPTEEQWLTAPRVVEADGMRIPTLPLSAEWWYLLVHGSQHFWSRMKWLADVPAVVLHRPEIVQPRRLEEAAAAGHDRSVATGLIVAEAAFGRFLPPESRAWARNVRGTSALVKKSWAALVAAHDPASQISPRALPGDVRARLNLRRDAAYRRGELRLMLLAAARAQAVENPGPMYLLRGPTSWARRSARRIARTHS